MPEKVEAQLALDEEVIDDKELEDLLERRLALYDRLAPIRKDYNELTSQVKEAIKEQLEPGTAGRIGRFRVEVVETAAREVEFTSGARVDVRIRTPKDE